MKTPLILSFILITWLSVFTSLAHADRALSSFRNKGITGTSKMANVTQSVANNQPVLVDKAINGLPAISFNGTNQYFNFDGAWLVNTDYTIFVVEKRGRAGINVLFGGFDYRLLIYYDNNNQIVFGIGGGSGAGIYAPVEEFTSAKEEPLRLHVFVQHSIGRQYYRNGALIATHPHGERLVAYNNATIGAGIIGGVEYYKGLIGEIAIYRRALSDDEIQLINKYLIAKWGIKEMKNGIGCNSASLGYYVPTNVVWSNGGVAANGGSITGSCISGSLAGGYIPRLTCGNGVYVTTGATVPGSCT